MTSVLLVNASSRLTESVSRRAGAALAACLCEIAPGEACLVRRDLCCDPPPLVGAAYADAVLQPAAEHTADQRTALADSEALIRELEAADALIIATPMHNFAVPAVLKAWIDQVLRIGRSFHRTPQGKQGLLVDRPTFVVVASGGLLTGQRANQPDFLTPYLTAVLATVGITDVAFGYLEGLAAGQVAVEAAQARFQTWMRDVTPGIRSLSLPANNQLSASGIGERN